MERIAINARTGMIRMGRFIRRNAGQIVYYGGVALALCLFAFAAQNLRDARMQPAEGDALPAAEMELPAEAQPPVFILPEEYEVMQAYAPSPVWNAQLGCWQCHMGMDFSCAGGAVRSISDGTIIAIGKDGVYGGWVEVCTGEYTLRYASIETDEKLEAGSTVKTGQIVGTANSSMSGEAYMPPHLHLEVSRNETSIDPLEIV